MDQNIYKINYSDAVKIQFNKEELERGMADDPLGLPAIAREGKAGAYYHVRIDDNGDLDFDDVIILVTTLEEGKGLEREGAISALNAIFLGPEHWTVNEDVGEGLEWLPEDEFVKPPAFELGPPLKGKLEPLSEEEEEAWLDENW